MELGWFGVLFAIIFVIALVFIIGSMVVHALMFGSVFHAVTRHVSQTLDEQQKTRESANKAAHCEFCGAARSLDQAPCPSCGAPQQTMTVAATVDPASRNRTDL